MSDTIPRRALGELPVNQVTMPLILDEYYDTLTGQKRSFSAMQWSEQNVKTPGCSVPERGAVGAQGSFQDENRDSAIIPDTGFAALKAAKTQTKTLPDATITPAYSPISEAPQTHHNDGRRRDDEDSQLSCNESSLSINDFDADESMQSHQTEATEITQPLRPRIVLHAESLRLRLRLAQFRVQTDQVNVPFAMLQTSFSTRSPCSKSGADVEDTLVMDVGSSHAPHMLSSPPLSPTTLALKTDQDVFRTPALPRHRQKGAERQLSTPPDSQETFCGFGGRDGLTSSAVKGDAAISLLGLRGSGY